MSTSITGPERRPRVVTIVWGALILAVAGLVLLGQFVALDIDPVVVALGLLIGVGVSLVAGGILSLRTRTTTDSQDDDALHAPGY
ncbi:hypothetical protein ACX80J_01690 [Arthrobacter sp. MDB2-24]